MVMIGETGRIQQRQAKGFATKEINGNLEEHTRHFVSR